MARRKINSEQLTGPSPVIRSIRDGIKPGQESVEVPVWLFEQMCRGWFMEYGTVAYYKRQHEKPKDPHWSEMRDLTDAERADFERQMQAYRDHDVATGRGRRSAPTSSKAPPAGKERLEGESETDYQKRRRRERAQARAARRGK